jgi:hypothetical protein
VPAEAQPKRFFRHRVERSAHRLPAGIWRAARYVYGTVDLPADQVMNWVGNAKTVDAAQQILGQGGIPNTALVKGGKIGAVHERATPSVGGAGGGYGVVDVSAATEGSRPAIGRVAPGGYE